MSKIIKGSLFAINQNIQAKAEQSILSEQINEFIELHSSVQQLSAQNQVKSSSIKH